MSNSFRLDLQGENSVFMTLCKTLLKIVLFLIWFTSLLGIIWLEFIKQECNPYGFDLACGGSEFGWYSIVPPVLFLIITVLFIIKRKSR